MSAILPGATLGLLGGGQLGALFAATARRTGYRVMLLEPDAHCPASLQVDEHIVAPYDDEAALRRLAANCAAVTSEFENVPASSLQQLAATVPVRPSAQAVAITQDRIIEKMFLRERSVPTARFAVVEHAADLAAAVSTIGFPAVLKSAREGYDGKGQASIATADEAPAAYASVGGGRCVLEERLDLQQELSVVLARGVGGQTAAYAVTENCHRNGILDVSLAPARVSPAMAQRAVAMAGSIALALDYVGVLAVEFFVTRDERLLVNELAPRPHNSGHWTLDAAVTSQFEQQLRVLCGFPPGDCGMSGGIAMVNLLGDLWREGAPDWSALLECPQARLWLYGKRDARPGRKMGHFTCRAADVPTALSLAGEIRRRLQDGQPQDSDAF